MPRRILLGNKGFTLVEMLVVITIIGILAAMAVPNYLKAKNKAKEAEVKSNLHVIQTALERYHVDHDSYPPYLIGGNRGAWTIWHRLHDSQYPNAVLLNDPLVANGYMDSYPANPFVSDGAAIVVETGGTTALAGSGDPRFGENGRIMGNVVDDPRYYRKDNPDIRDPLIETYLTIAPTASMFGDYYHYEMGGHTLPDGTRVRLTWYGNFFYRAIRDVKLGRTGATDGIARYPDFGWSASNSYYILGGFGAEETRGLDVIRYDNRNSTGAQLQYRTPPESGLTIPIGRAGVDGNGIPEVFGGGDINNGPVWPYTYDIDNKGITEMRFGAGDGIEDGIVLVLTSSGNNFQF
jgi:prepilin-type N-terminal cleavage/methylation domain-containing protein